MKINRLEEYKKQIDDPNTPEWKRIQLESKVAILERKKHPKMLWSKRETYRKQGENNGN